MKKYLLLFLFCTMLIGVFGQVSIQPILPLAGMIQKSNLWNVAIINTTGETVDCRLELILRDRATGIEALTATTGQFQIGPGARQVNASLLMPIQYNLLSPALTARTDDFIPVGDYIACYRLTANKNIAAEECALFDVEPLSPPMLVNPPDSSLLEASPTQFTWIPPAPMNLFNRLQYEVLITEISEGQKAEEAIQQNLPFYTEPNVPVNNLSYRGMATDFAKDKWYAWQVVAKDDNNYAGMSEVFVFKVTEKVNNEIVEATPFTKMKTDNIELAVAPNGILKLAYHNELRDSLAQIVIQDMSTAKPGGNEVSFNSKLIAGDNYIQYDLKKIMKPKEGKIYNTVFTNGRGEKFQLRFAVKYFNKDKK